MAENLDAKVLTKSMQILMKKVQDIQKKLKLTRNDIDWNVLESPIMCLKYNTFSPMALGKDDVGCVMINPNKVWISSSIINSSSPMETIITKSGLSKSSSEDSLTDAILQALAYIETGDKTYKYDQILQNYRIKLGLSIKK